MSIMFNAICINKEMLPKFYIYIYIYIHIYIYIYIYINSIWHQIICMGWYTVKANQLSKYYQFSSLSIKKGKIENWLNLLVLIINM